MANYFSILAWEIPWTQGPGHVNVKVTQSCLTFCDAKDYTDHGILQARLQEWWPFPSPGDLPNSGIEPRSPSMLEDSLPAEP